MRSFRDLVVIKQPLEQVWATVRDRLPELAAQLDDIDRIVVIERESIGPGRLRLVNEWRSGQRIPKLLQSRFGAEVVSWIDRNQWDEDSRVCTWAIEPSLLSEHIRCAGSTSYMPAMGGRGTRITFAGEFELASGALRGLAGPLEQPLAAFVESIVTVFIPRNLRKVMDAAERLIASGA
jgi:hypothetical protein